MMFPDIASFLLNTQILPTQHHQKDENRKRKNSGVHLALVHVKNANNNLCESPLTSLVIVTRSICIHVRKANCWKSTQNDGQDAVSVPIRGNILSNLLVLFSTMRKLTLIGFLATNPQTNPLRSACHDE